jgi:hypothetical protein
VAHIGGMSFTDNPKEVQLVDFHFRPYERFLYEYDFRDQWQHEIRLEKRIPLDSKQTYPVCIGGARKVPPEDCGGPGSFLALESHYSMLYMAGRMLEIVRDLMYWMSVNQFDRRAVNRRLKLYAIGDDEWRWL